MSSERVMLEMLYWKLRAVADAEDGPKFKGWPERWMDAGLRRCINDHVSSFVLKSEALGRDACLAAGCRAPLWLTFPEDHDGPLYVQVEDGKLIGNPPGCNCEHIHRSSATCPCGAPSKGAIKDRPTSSV